MLTYYFKHKFKWSYNWPLGFFSSGTYFFKLFPYYWTLIFHIISIILINIIMNIFSYKDVSILLLSLVCFLYVNCWIKHEMLVSMKWCLVNGVWFILLSFSNMKLWVKKMQTIESKAWVHILASPFSLWPWVSY
jgi:hypothetical protein